MLKERIAKNPGQSGTPTETTTAHGTKGETRRVSAADLQMTEAQINSPRVGGNARQYDSTWSKGPMVTSSDDWPTMTQPCMKIV